MTTIVTRAVKGAPLTYAEMDANFNNLNSDKLEAGFPATSVANTPAGTISSVTVQAAINELDIEKLATTATALNGTTIPASKTLVVTTDIGSTVQAYNANTIAVAPGTSANVLTSNGSAWTSVPLPDVTEPYVYVREEQTSGTAGGTFTAAAWQTRTLNTEVYDTAVIASLSANQVTLPAGTYRFKASAPAFYVNAHKTRLQNITDASTVAVGTSENTSTGISPSGVVTYSEVIGRFTIAGSKAFSLQHYCSSTQATNGFGLAASIASTVEVYSQLEFWKEV